jgi:hypothetical protein
VEVKASIEAILAARRAGLEPGIGITTLTLNMRDDLGCEERQLSDWHVERMRLLAGAIRDNFPAKAKE